MNRNTHQERSWLKASLPFAWIIVLLATPYLAAADTASSPDGPAGGPIAQDVRFSEVTLDSFTATWAGNQILVEWRTRTEVYNQGFNLYRIDRASRNSMRLNGKVIPSLSVPPSGGARYPFLDTSVETGGQYDYWLEFLDIQGLPHYLGTISLARPEPRYRLFLPNIQG